MKSILFPQFKTNPITGLLLSLRGSNAEETSAFARLAKLGKVRINLHRPIPDGFAVKQIKVIKKAIGWFAIVSIFKDVEIPQPLRTVISLVWM